MRIPAGFALILLGLASTATAEPKQEQTGARVRLSKAAPTRRDAPRQPGDWLELASATPAKHGKEFVVVGKQLGTFGALRLDVSKGKVMVLWVKVIFDDGATKTYALDIRLDARRRKSTILDLETNKAIERVIVTTQKHPSGEYALFGASSLPAVAGR